MSCPTSVNQYQSNIFLLQIYIRNVTNESGRRISKGIDDEMLRVSWASAIVDSSHSTDPQREREITKITIIKWHYKSQDEFDPISRNFRFPWGISHSTQHFHACPASRVQHYAPGILKSPFSFCSASSSDFFILKRPLKRSHKNWIRLRIQRDKFVQGPLKH